MSLKSHNEISDRLELIETKGAGADKGERFGLQPKISGVCRTCVHAHIMERKYNNKLTVHCRVLERDVPNDVSRCNSYNKYGDMSLYEMNNICTLIDITPQVGFMVGKGEK